MSTTFDTTKVDCILGKYIHHSSDLVDSVKRMMKYSQILSSHAHLYDFKDIKANGFRSMVNLADKFLELIANLKISEHSRDIDVLTKMAKSISMLLHLSNLIRENISDADDASKSAVNFSTNARVNIDIISHVEAYKDILPSFFDKYGNYQYSAALQSALRLYIGVASLIWSGPFSIKNMFNLVTNHYACTGEVFADFGLNCDHKTFIKVLNVFTNSYYTGAVSLMMNGMNKLSIDDTRYLDVTTKYKISENGDLREMPEPVARAKSIRCRYYLNRFDGKNDTLVLHVHGSAFLAMSTESFQAITRGWSAKMDTVPILSVNYSLSPENKFPVALQEILDVYLYTLSGSERVKEQLGFNPSRIVVTGDSAGANILMALLLVINDLNKRLNTAIALPKAAMLIYPALTVSFSLTPSRLFTVNDVVLPTYLVMEVIKSYVDLTDELNEDNLSEDDKKKKWFRRNYSNEHFRSIQKKTEMPYISPLFYDDFQSLASVDLYLVTSEYDVFLDDSISLAHKWKGKICLDVVPDLPHAFLHFMGTANEITAAYDLCTDRLCQSVLN